MGCRATWKVLSTTVDRSWAARGIGAALDLGPGPVYGDRARLKLGWDMSLWGYRELETSSPTAASLGQGVRALRADMRLWPLGTTGEDLGSRQVHCDPVGMTVKLTLTPAEQQFFGSHTLDSSHQILHLSLPMLFFSIPWNIYFLSYTLCLVLVLFCFLCLLLCYFYPIIVLIPFILSSSIPDPCKQCVSKVTGLGRQK